MELSKADYIEGTKNLKEGLKEQLLKSKKNTLFFNHVGQFFTGVMSPQKTVSKIEILNDFPKFCIKCISCKLSAGARISLKAAVKIPKVKRGIDEEFHGLVTSICEKIEQGKIFLIIVNGSGGLSGYMSECQNSTSDFMTVSKLEKVDLDEILRMKGEQF